MAVGTWTPPSRDTVREALGFEPSSDEQEEILDSVARFILMAGGEQAGKSYTAAEYLTERNYELDRPGVFWLVGEKYENCFKEWEYILANFLKLDAVAPGDYTDIKDPGKPRYMWLRDGTKVRTITAGATENIIGESPDGIVVCEASQLSYEGYQKVRARSSHGHGWLFMSGTFEWEKQSWYPSLFEEWSLLQDDDHATFLAESHKNRVVYPEGENAPDLVALRADVTDEFYEERILGKVRKPKDLVFRDYFLIDKHVKQVPFLPDFPVGITIDPGYSQGCHSLQAIQRPPNSPIRVFDEIYGTAISTEEMIEIAQAKPWYGNLTNPEKQLADISVIDIQGTKWQQTVTPPAQVWQHRTGIVLRSQQVAIMDGIDRLKTFLRLDQHGQPRLIINNTNYGLLSELGVCKSPVSNRMEAYKYRMKDGIIEGIKPIPKANHSLNGLWYWLIIAYGYVTRARSSKVVKVLSHA